MENKNSIISPEKAIYNWLETVSRHNPIDIVNLYAIDGVLLGTIANNIKNNDKSRSEEYVEIPEVETDDVIANNTLEKPSSGKRKK